MENIKDSIFKFLRIDNLIDNLVGYVEARVDLLKIEIKEDIAKVLARALMACAILFLALLFLLFFSVGLAHYINTFFESPYSGYWIVSGIYGIPCIAVVLLRKRINSYFEEYMREVIKRKEK